MHVKDAMKAAREAGFVITHYFDGTSGTAQLVHTNGNMLHIDVHQGEFAGATGYGWGDAPWTGAQWTTGDASEFAAWVTT
jgi:hypothetical protein